MKLHPNLLAASSLLAILSPSAVRADDSVLSFELSQPQWAATTPAAETVAYVPTPVPTPDADSDSNFDSGSMPLPIPARAANPPMRYHSPQQLPAGVYRRGVAVALNESTSATALLPPAPPVATAPVMVAVSAPVPSPEPPKELERELDKEPELLALDFEVEPSPAIVMAQAKLLTPKQPADPLPSLFEGNSDSLVAWAVGSAEGTRTPNGAINPAYFGHTDPGNRVWNMGTFSYQHGAKTPEEADQKQLARLQNQGDVLRQRALKHGLNLTLEETLNGLDLANQSPLAAIGRVGYIERLAEAKQNGLDGTEAILVARTRSYINPNTGRWNAPGLGNTEASIRRDQQRRANAVASAIAAYESQHPQLQAQTWALTPSSEPAPDTLVVLADSSTEPVDEFLTMWTSPSDPIAQAEPAAETALWGETAVTETDTLAASTASDDGGLAALWQLTVGRLAALDSGGPGQPGPQAASLVGLFARGSGTPQPAAVEPEPEVAASLEAPDQAVVAEPAESAAPEPAISVVEPAPIAIVPPTWAEVREGSQQVPSPALEAAAVPGAFPDSAVYAPIAPAAESVVPELPPATTAPTDPETAPELSPPSLVPEAAPESTASSPESEESATAEANSLAESSALAPETLETAEPALSEHENILEFDQVDGSD